MGECLGFLVKESSEESIFSKYSVLILVRVREDVTWGYLIMQLIIILDRSVVPIRDRNLGFQGVRETFRRTDSTNPFCRSFDVSTWLTLWSDERLSNFFLSIYHLTVSTNNNCRYNYCGYIQHRFFNEDLKHLWTPF